MTTKLLLHIGINKTGTSAIQHWFAANRTTLQARGLLYPATGRQIDAHYGMSTTLGFSSATKDPADVGRMLSMRDLLRQEIEMANATQVVVSSENFMLPRDLYPVQDMFRGMDTRVIVYLRRHDSWLESAFTQAIKQVKMPPYERGFSPFLAFQRKADPNYGNFRALVDRWAEAFGKENIIVRPYEAQQNNPDLVSDFLNAGDLGAYAAGLDTATPRINTNRQPDMLQMLELYQRAEIDETERAALIHFALTAPDTREKKFSLLSPAKRREFAEANSADYQYIAREFMHRDDGKLFLDPLPEPTDEWQAPVWLTPPQIVGETVKALTAGKQGAAARNGFFKRLFSLS